MGQGLKQVGVKGNPLGYGGLQQLMQGNLPVPRDFGISLDMLQKLSGDVLCGFGLWVIASIHVHQISQCAKACQ